MGLEVEGILPKDKPQLRWSIFSNRGPDEMLRVVTQEVFPFIKDLGGKGSIYSKFMKDAIFRNTDAIFTGKSCSWY
ncbi:hypothetical protein [Priestia aryabhattai]|uniref:hypothetical protein n=1 Tax=Priestia aryabhattai TaxID=412384 RepID=UPI003D282BD1